MPRRPILDGPAHSVHLHSPYIVVFMQRCGMIYVLGGSLTLRYKGKGNLLIDGRHRKDYGGAPATSVKAMEMHQGPRPVYGGPGRIGLIGMAPQGNRAGGPGVLWTPGRRPPHRNGGTFGSFGHERTTMQQEIVKYKAAELSRQLTYKTNHTKGQ